MSPVIELFLAQRNGTISDSEFNTSINELKTIDSRNQQLKYFYRSSINQQYQTNISGGGSRQKYFISLGYDKNLSNDVTRSNNRTTFNANNSYFFFKNKLEIFSGITFTSSNNQFAPLGGSAYPYGQLVDDNGNSTIIAKDLRIDYAKTVGNGKLLDWLYRPYDDLKNGYNTSKTKLSDYRLSFKLNYKIINELTASLAYTYQKGQSDFRKLDEVNSYFTRNQINQFTQINKVTGEVIRPLPLGDILRTGTDLTSSYNARAQINYNKVWNKHSLSAIIGSDFGDNTGLSGVNYIYGYNSETHTNQNAKINPTVDYPYYNGNGVGRINIAPFEQGTTNRFISYFLNSSYAYLDRYITSFSLRKDESNVFGVSSNQKGVPLYSLGIGWVINKETFFKVNWVSQLKIRGTFGYTGNVNNSISALLTANSGLPNRYGVNYSEILNPPNPSLRWEKVKNINIGVDFDIFKNRISGSVDFWTKKGIDLIGKSPIAPQTGISVFTGNSANTITKGIDLQINSLNLNGTLKWSTTLLYNYQNSKVTEYKVENGNNGNIVKANYNNPLKGYPFYAVFSFNYAGLDQSGNPQAYLNGAPSIDYGAILNSTNRSELVFNGSGAPTSFGSIMNTFSYGRVDISFNIIFKLGYFFRRNSLDNNQIYSNTPGSQMSDYNKRWKKSGDEFQTNVPALNYPNDPNRYDIYTYSNILVEKGDHIRFNDLRLGYTFANKAKMVFKDFKLFTYVSNIGLIWKANHKGIDPDAIFGFPTPRTIAFGLNLTL